MKQMRLLAACALAVMTVAPVQAQVQEIVLHNFEMATGRNPTAGVTLEPDGIYGTTALRGTGGGGVLYKWDTASHYTVLHNFVDADGYGPIAGVIRDSAGNLYGTTYRGGTADSGVVYKLDSAGNYTVLYNFTGGADGGTPYAGVILDSAGNLYGTATGGGTAGYGVVYKLDSAGNYTVLYNFPGGESPNYSGVVRDSAGNLYGTAGGVVYKLDADDNYTFHSFTITDGAVPNGVILAPDGLYGTTQSGGTGGSGDHGVIFKLGASGDFTTLYSFTGLADGGLPLAGVIRDSAGNLYGTTQSGGTADKGVVYKLDSAGNYTVLRNFTRTDGALPQAPVLLSPAGNLIGTTLEGGSDNNGVLFELTGVQ